MTTPIDRVRSDFLGLQFDCIDDLGVDAVLGAADPDAPLSILVTPNVDHMVRIGRDDADATALAALYRRADYCLCDSRVLASLAMLCGISLPVHPGSDLVRRIFAEQLHAGDRISIIGGDEQLKEGVARLRPDVEIVQHCPPMGLRHKPASIREAAEFVAASGARFHFLSVGSPQQEMIAVEARSIPAGGGMALCIGSGLDFLAGNLRRAPQWMQRLSLEWLFRLLSEPRRLWRRYLLDGPKIFVMVWKWQALRKSAGSQM